MCWNFSQEYRKLVYEHYLQPGFVSSKKKNRNAKNMASAAFRWSKKQQERRSSAFRFETNPVSNDITILHVNLAYEKLFIHCNMFCKLDVRR